MTAPRVTRADVLVASAPFVAVTVALALGAIAIALLGQDPLAIYARLAHEAFGTGYGLGQTLFRATPLVFAGLSVSLAFRAGLFNVGAEGQMLLGGFVAGLVGAHAHLPGPLLLPVALLAAAAAGALWGAIPGVLKARTGAHEVIVTIMLNFIAVSIVGWLGHRVFEPATVHTPEVAASGWLPRLDHLVPALAGSPANLAFPLALVLAVAVGVLLFRTRRGYELRALGLNAPAAAYGGVAIGATQVVALALAGALAGLGGCNFVLGYKHFFELGFTAGAGFLGIAVALLGRNSPLGVVVAALLFGALSYGGLIVNERVPRELIEVLEALVILCAITARPVLERLARRLA